jgi:rubrerythrin
MQYNSKWDLSTIPDDLLRSEFGRRIKPPAPRARVELPCVQCATPLSARERRKRCPKCGSRQPRELKG